MVMDVEGERRQVGAGRRLCRYLASECHYTSLCWCYNDQKAFIFTPWLPYKLKYQWVYVVYRWILALYFFSWLVYTAALAGQDSSVQAKYLIYLTNWGFLFFNAYLLTAALSVSLSLLLCHCNPSTSLDLLTDSTDQQRMQCSLLSCVHGLHWALSVIGLEFAVGITVLFWSFFNDPANQSFTLGPTSVHVHMVNGIVAFLDIWITGLPFRILHFVYAVLFASSYVVFTGVYYIAGGTDINSYTYIYPVLDYADNPGLAAGVGVSCTLLLSCALHMLFYFMSLARYWLSRIVQTKLYISRTEEVMTLEEQTPLKV